MERFQIEPLRSGLTELLAAHGVPQKQARTLLDSMLAADLRGVHTHGLAVLPAYLSKIDWGGFALGEKTEVLRQTAAFAVVDAKGQLGAVSASDCMALALEGARRSGLFTVFCRNANTFGPAFYYAKMAADRGLIGACCCNSPTAMPAWGGTKKLLGTNPFSVAVPARSFAPIVVDMATSVVAKSKINEIRKQGGTIPEGWAVDARGVPTTDPAAAIEGMVLPMAAHKGSAIAMAIDLLAGVLSGAGYQNRVNRFYSEENRCMNVGQCFAALDPTLIADDSFYDTVDDYILALHASGEAVLYPGEREQAAYEEAMRGGVALSEETAAALRGICGAEHRMGVLVKHGA